MLKNILETQLDLLDSICTTTLRQLGAKYNHKTCYGKSYFHFEKKIVLSFKLIIQYE